jgi:hypothetical protein
MHQADLGDAGGEGGDVAQVAPEPALNPDRLERDISDSTLCIV